MKEFADLHWAQRATFELEESLQKNIGMASRKHCALTSRLMINQVSRSVKDFAKGSKREQ